MSIFLVSILFLNLLVVSTNLLVLIRLVFLLHTLNRNLKNKPHKPDVYLDEEGEQILDFLAKANKK